MKLVITFLSGGRAGQSLMVNPSDLIRFGRRPENEIAVDAGSDIVVSGFHAEIRHNGSAYEIIDLESRNGTFVEGQRIRSCVLGREAQIQLGADGPCLKLEFQDDPVSAAASAPSQPVQPAGPSEAGAHPAKPPLLRWQLLLAILLAVLLISAVAGVLVWRFAGNRSPEPLSPDQCGQVIMELVPGSPLAIRVGVARIDLPRDALASPGRITAELRADRSLEIVLDPPQELAFPATVFLPLPSGADLADPFGPRGPVALLVSEARIPLLVRPEKIGGDGMIVRVPHFSKVWPLTNDDARKWLARQGQTMADLIAGSSPAMLNVVSVKRPKSFSTSDDLTSIEISVQAVTSAGAVPDDRTRPFFSNLAVRASMANDAEIASSRLDDRGRGTLLVKPAQPGPGKPPVLVVVLTLLAADGSPITTTTITLPAGKLWASVDCNDSNAPGKPKRFTIYYLNHQALSDAPDAGYRGSVSAAGTVPARVLDACTALLVAHEAYRSRDFRDPGSVPGETDVWLQPWEESEASRMRDYIMPKTMSPDGFDSFKVSVAHELAHRFQHQYSWGYTGGWFHDASAEFLSNKAFGYERNVDRLTLSTSPDWLHRGMMSGGDIAAYGYASFLAYLADRYRIEIGRLWPDSGNASSWASVLDSRLRSGGSSLSGAFEEFARVWMIDHNWGSGWTDPRVEDGLITLLRSNDFSFNKSTSRIRQRFDVAYLSAGGAAISWRGPVGDAAVIAGRIVAPAGKGWMGLVPGEVPNGQAGKTFALASGGKINPGTEKISVELGASKSALDPKGARITYWYSDWSDIGGSPGAVSIDLWAIPRLSDLKVQEDAARQKTLSWSPSPLEKEKDIFKEFEVELRDSRGQVIHSATSRTPSLLLPADSLDKAAEVCVRVRDTEDNRGPDACLSMGIGELQGRWLWISRLGQLNGKEVAMQYQVDFGPPLPDGTISRCSAMIGSIDAGANRAPGPSRCTQQEWKAGGRGVVFSQGKWKADCAIDRRSGLRLDCVVEEPFGTAINRLTADAVKQ